MAKFSGERKATTGEKKALKANQDGFACVAIGGLWNWQVSGRAIADLDGIDWYERETLIVAYTHGQPAQPTTFGHYLAAALEVLLREPAHRFGEQLLLFGEVEVHGRELSITGLHGARCVTAPSNRPCG